VLACIRPDVFSSMSGRLPVLDQFLISFQVPMNRTMWYPVRTRVSLRQESQFKYDRPEVSQLWSGCTCIKEGNRRFDFNRPDNCLSWSRRAHYRYGNWVLKNSRPDAREPYKEITCSGRTTVRTMCHPVQTMSLNRKDFSANFLENLVAQLSVRTSHVHRLDGAQVYFA
jgi:hypothetical protein